MCRLLAASIIKIWENTVDGLLKRVTIIPNGASKETSLVSWNRTNSATKLADPLNLDKSVKVCPKDSTISDFTN